MAISKFKKRYNITLTISKVERFESLSSELNLSKMMNLSNLFDESLEKTSDLLQMLKDKGSLTIDDLRATQGQQLDLLKKEEKKDVIKKREEKDGKGKSAQTARK